VRYQPPKLALQAQLAYASKINEKGPYSTFPYGYTQAAKTPVKASNLQFLTCGRRYDGLASLFDVQRPTSTPLAHVQCPTSSAIPLIGARRTTPSAQPSHNAKRPTIAQRQTPNHRTTPSAQPSHNAKRPTIAQRPTPNA